MGHLKIMKLTVDILGNGQQEKIFFIDSYLGMVKWSEKYHLQYLCGTESGTTVLLQ